MIWSNNIKRSTTFARSCLDMLNCRSWGVTLSLPRSRDLCQISELHFLERNDQKCSLWELPKITCTMLHLLFDRICMQAIKSANLPTETQGSNNEKPNIGTFATEESTFASLLPSLLTPKWHELLTFDLQHIRLFALDADRPIRSEAIIQCLFFHSCSTAPMPKIIVLPGPVLSGSLSFAVKCSIHKRLHGWNTGAMISWCCGFQD